MHRDDQRLAAGRALFAKVLADEVAREVKHSRDVVEPTLVAGEKVKAALPDGEVVGSLQLTEQPASVVVTDEAALLDYVKRARPDEVVVRESIRDSFLTYLKSVAKDQLDDDTHGGLVVDPNGEVIPGLELRYGTPRYRPEVTTYGRRTIRARLAQLLGGELRERLALDPGEEP